MKVTVKKFALVCIVCSIPSLSFAQEVCFEEAKDNFSKWRSSNGKLLDELSQKYLNSNDPSKEMVDYNGMKMPIAAALIIEGQRYGESADKKLTQEVDNAKECSGQTAIARGAYDLARTWLGLTTILPEQATRIDFEEIRRGNFAGGKNSIINEAGRKIDETLNPFRWKL